MQRMTLSSSEVSQHHGVMGAYGFLRPNQKERERERDRQRYREREGEKGMNKRMRRERNERTDAGINEYMKE